MTKSTDTEYYYALLTEGRMDLMHLPSGAVAWLWQHNRPQAQVDSAAMVASTAHHMGDAIIDSALLRADQNVLVLHTQTGLRINVYPDGGLGSGGEPLDADPMAIQAFLSGEVMDTAISTGVLGMDDMMGTDMDADLGTAMIQGDPMGGQIL